MAEVFTTYESAVEWLQTDLVDESRLHKGASGFEDSRKLLEHLGNPQEEYPTIHIAGTSGKGSVAWLASKLLIADGKRVGTIMSPHVYDFRERFLVNCDKVATSIIIESVNELRAKLNQLRKQKVFVSYFQAVVALGYLVFKKQGVDTAVVEVGIGGKLDSTNHIQRDKVAVITTIGSDHTEILGESIAEITEQKAGIITPSSKVVALSQSNEINEIIEQRITEVDVESVRVQGVEDPIKTNAKLAIAAVEMLLMKPVGQSIDMLADDFSLPGRFEVRNTGERLIVLDGAHNEQKIGALVRSLKLRFPDRRFAVLLAMAGKRTNEVIIEMLTDVASEIVFTKYSTLAQLPTKAALDFSTMNLESIEIPHRVINDQNKALQSLQGKDLLVTGSFYLVGEIGARLS